LICHVNCAGSKSPSGFLIPVFIQVGLSFRTGDISTVFIQVELSFRTGDIITVFGDMDDDGFYMAELRGHRGLVPRYTDR
jgi:hypothetical protein